ncbi:hypothetical protein GGF44_003255 [Coemansia sp. RSA 1694]|nr:hypothetical protein IWW47_000494 [Coemansia sp. RSA 2052]KAJ2635844.1 hypothetical protein GGF44_003255 [Coemansia sp. RSA 1694]
MVSLFKYATGVAALAAICSVQVSGAKAPKPPKASKCDPQTATVTKCVKSTKYKYCDEEKSIWATATLAPDMSCDENDILVQDGNNPNSASHLASGPVALALGMAIAMWQFM